MDPWRRRFWILLAILVGGPLVISIVLAIRFLPNRPVTYARIEDHFKYGSTGGYAASGFPYWIWQAMPVVFKDRLPKNGGKGYEAFGMIFEPGHDLPIGVQKGRNMGIDRVFVNCAVCHHSTVRDTPTALRVSTSACLRRGSISARSSSSSSILRPTSGSTPTTSSRRSSARPAISACSIATSSTRSPSL